MPIHPAAAQSSCTLYEPVFTSSGFPIDWCGVLLSHRLRLVQLAAGVLSLPGAVCACARSHLCTSNLVGCWAAIFSPWVAVPAP